jgi:Tfp pilus assembly PilM family ATPase
MKSGLSIYFNIDRVYLLILSQNEKGLKLEYVDSTRHQVDLEYPEDPDSQKGIEEIYQFIEKVKDRIDHITITIPAESVFVTQFPGKVGMSEEQLSKLVDLEIKQAFPQFNAEEFVSNIYPLEVDKKEKSMMLASIMQREIISTLNNIFDKYLPVSNIEISQINAHTAFLYNYPEAMDKTTIIMGVQDQFIDVSLIKNNKPAYYNLLSFSNKEKFAELIEEAYNTIKKDITDQIDGIYFFGTGLTKQLYFSAWEMASLLELETNRLNAFRMLTTDLDQRQKDYCSRLQHVFPPCIGAAIPEYHKRIRLY